MEQAGNVASQTMEVKKSQKLTQKVMQPGGCPKRSQKRGDVGRPQEVPSRVPEAESAAQTDQVPENPHMVDEGWAALRRTRRRMALIVHIVDMC